jgi:membrane-associated protein
VIQFLTHFRGPIVYLLVAGLLVAESGFAIGFFVPGELAIVLGGVLAKEHRVNLPVMLAVAVAAAIGSYLLGYWLGRLILPWVLEHTKLNEHPMVKKYRNQLQTRGGPAVFIARFIVVVRAVMPALAGLSDIRLRTFVVFDIAGGVIWATVYTLLGFALGTAYQRVLHDIGVWSYVVVGVLVVGAVAFHLWRTRRMRHRAREDGSQGHRSP